MMVNPILSITSLGKTFAVRGGPDIEALQGVAFDLHVGEVIALVGPSGCGKSTIFNIIAGLTRPSCGRVNYGQEAGEGFRIGCVFQESRLLPWLSVRQNVLFALQGTHGAGLQHSEKEQRLADLLDMVGIAPFANRYPHELSGGMQQRVALARALSIDPHVLLMDEPFGALDALTRRHLQEELARIVEMAKKSVVLITHDIDEAFLLADRVLVMTHRPGRIKADLPLPFARPRRPEDLERDARCHEIKVHVLDLLRKEVAQHLRSSREWTAVRGALAGGDGVANSG